MPDLRSGDFDWLQFTNGEWLKGRIKDLQDATFTFESDQLDVLRLDWDDVHALYSTQPNTLLFETKHSTEGTIHIEGDTVTVTTSQGNETYSRDLLRSIIPGQQTEWNYWSGKLSIEATVSRGNVNQSDGSLSFRVQRRSPETRLRLDYNGVYSSVEGEETANNHRGLLTYDIYLTRRLYLRLLGFEAYRDKFQNIEYRLTPAAGVGYDLLDRDGLEWSVFGGAGYQYTDFWTVPPGEENSRGTAAIIGGTELNWDATSRIEAGLRYNITVPVPETSTFNHHAEVYVSFDVWTDLDFDARLT